MIDEIRPDLFRLEVPLPRNPLRAVNCYVFRGGSRNLIIDTGMNREECRSVLRAGLDELQIDLDSTDILITHMHADHSGLVPRLLASKSTAYVGRMDAETMRSGPAWDAARRNAVLNGFPADRLGSAIQNHPGKRYGGYGEVEYTILNEGDLLSVGEYSFRCIETPGHTDGHICLYEPVMKMLISGDHILGDITPNISSWDDYDQLGWYLESLDKIRPLEVELVLPGHRRVFGDCRGRIQELKRHHRVRLGEVLSILEGMPMSGYQVAAQMTWDMTYDSFEAFPVSQQWFAAGEAMAHLHHLGSKGLVQKEMRNGVVVFHR